jgi:hypothetical protein
MEGEDSLLLSQNPTTGPLMCLAALLTDTKESSPLAQWASRPTTLSLWMWPISGSTVTSSVCYQFWRVVCGTMSSGSHLRRIVRVTRWHFPVSIELIYSRRHFVFDHSLLKKIEKRWWVLQAVRQLQHVWKARQQERSKLIFQPCHICMPVVHLFLCRYQKPMAL